MLKYYEVFHIGLKEQMAYRFDVISGAVFSVAKVLLAYILWGAIFKGKTEVGGYTFEMMMTYYLAVAFFMQLEKSKDMVWQFAGEIRQGQFTKYVVRPINPIGVFMALSISKTTYIIGLNVVAFIGWILLFRQHLYVPELLHVGWAIVFVVMGLMVMMQLNYLITMFSFKIVSIAGLLFSVMNITSLLSGELVPLDFLPTVVEQAVRFLPFYYVLYFPASLLLGMNQEIIGQGLIVVIFWLLALAVINQRMYKGLFSHYEGVGI